MEAELQAPSRSIAYVLVVAMLQGLLLWWVIRTQNLGIWPGNTHAWHATLLSLAVILAPVIYGLTPWTHGVRAWGIVALIAALAVVSSWHFGSHELPPGAALWPSNVPPFALLLVQVLVLFHALPFIQIYLIQGRWRCGYDLLFSRTWQNALQLGLAALFTSIFWALLMLWAELFKMIGLPFAQVLLTQIPGYSLIVLALGFGVGFYLVGSADRLLAVLRQQVLSLLKWLVPVAALILVAFAIALLLRTPALLAEHRHVIRAVWLLWLVIVSIYLLNAAYQDGSVATPYPVLLGRLLRWTTPLLVVLSAMAAYDLWVRVTAYGLTTSRVWAVVVTATTFAYSIGYALASRRANPWMAPIGRANVWLALLVIATLSLTLSPVLYPERLAARSQAARLARSSGVAGPADFMALRFDFGDYGYQKLKSLAADKATPESIRKGAQLALQVNDRQARGKFSYTTVPESAIAMVLEAIPAGAQIDDALRRKIQEKGAGIIARVAIDPGDDPHDVASPAAYTKNKPGLACVTDDPCPVVFVDLDNDGQVEAVVFRGTQAEVFQKQFAEWQEVGSAFRPAYAATTPQELLSQLRKGGFQAVERHWKMLKIGRELLRLELPEEPQRRGKSSPLERPVPQGIEIQPPALHPADGRE